MGPSSLSSVRSSSSLAASPSGRSRSSGFFGAGAQQLLRRAAAARAAGQAGQQRLGTLGVQCFKLQGNRDRAKEERLKHFRAASLFDYDKWAAHRSTQRYLRHFLGLFSSRIVASLRIPLLLIGLEAAVICYWESVLVPLGWRSIQVKMPQLFSLSSFALSLLLVFRTNNSYARFDEARRLWGLLINRSRDFNRQASAYLGPEQSELHAVLSTWLRVFPWVMKNYVREEKSWQADLEPLLGPEDLQAVAGSNHPPLVTLHALTEVLDRCQLTEKQRLALDACVTSLTEMVGACERILRTPIPLSYTRHTARFLVIWLGLLPFSIYQTCGWVTVFSSVVVAFVLLATDEIAVSLEEPFCILPLEELNIIVCDNVRQFSSQDELGAITAMVDRQTGVPRPTTRGSARFRPEY